MPVLNVPDTIFDNPTQNDLNPTSLVPLGGRLMCSSPHVDGLILFDANRLQSSGGGAQTVVRNAKGDWSLNIAASAATVFVRGCNPTIQRIGELYNLGEFSASGVQTNYPPAPPKGIAILDFFAIYSVGTAALTSATLRLGKTVYSKTAGGAAFAQTDLVAATAIQTATTPSLSQYTYQDVAGPSSVTAGPYVFSADDIGMLEVELSWVNPGTSVVQVASLGAHCLFNYD
jgi:hypothetical protein